MNIFRLLFELFIVYILYKFIFEFIIPVYKTSKQVNEKMKNFQRQAEQQSTPPPGSSTMFNKTGEKISPPKEDYIDYEELK